MADKDMEDILTLLKAAGKILGRNAERFAGKGADYLLDNLERASAAYRKRVETMPADMPEAGKHAAAIGGILGSTLDSMVRTLADASKEVKEALDAREGKPAKPESPVKCYEISMTEYKPINLTKSDNVIIAVNETNGRWYVVVDHSQKETEALLAAYGVKLGRDVPLDEYKQMLKQEADKKKQSRRKKTGGK